MTDDPRWLSLIGRITPDAAADLDALIDAADPQPRRVGRDLAPGAGPALPRPRLRRPDAVAVGVRVRSAPTDAADAADRAMRLAAFALERDVEIVILAHADSSGFEGYGFRVERVVGETEAARAACEDQIRRFWGIELVL